MKIRRATAILAVIALIPVLPFALGYGRQDFIFHVESWFSLADAWRNGHFLPVWAPAASFNLGDPHLGLYPPLSFILGALLTLILPIQIAPAAFVWLAVLGCGLGMYYSSRFFLAQQDRLTAAILYMLSPYVIANAIIRFAAAELLLQSFLPLILLAACRLCATSIQEKTFKEEPPQEEESSFWRSQNLRIRLSDGSRSQIPVLATLLTLAWLTNFPGSIVIFYGLSILAILAAIHQRSLQPAIRIAAAEALALALAAFRLLPTWAEHSWIDEAILYKRDPRMGLLFMRPPPFPDNVLLIVFWIVLCAEALVLHACLRKRPLSKDTRIWTWLAAIAIFFQIPLAYPLWTILPELRVVQFPFRFLLFLAPILPLLLFAPATHRTLRRPVYISIAALNVMPLMLFLAMHSVTGADRIAATAATWRTQGYESAPEYVPPHATVPTHPLNLPPVAAISHACSVTLLQSADLSRAFASQSAYPCVVRLSIFFHPYWQASESTGNKLPTAQDATGLLLVTVPPGAHTASVSFHPVSRTRAVGLAISLAALLLLIGLYLSKPRHKLSA